MTEYRSRRGKPPTLSQADKNELWECRRAGVSIARLSAMWGFTPRYVQKLLAEQRARRGEIETLPEAKRHLVRARRVNTDDASPASSNQH